MKSFWLQRTTREKILMLLCALIALGALANLVIPSIVRSDSLKQQQQIFKRNLTFLSWAKRAKTHLSELKPLPYALQHATLNTDWPTALRQLLKGSALGESLSVISQTQHTLTLRFSHAPFDALLVQLTQWQRAGLIVEQFSSQTTHTPGICNITAVLQLPKLKTGEQA